MFKHKMSQKEEGNVYRYAILSVFFAHKFLFSDYEQQNGRLHQKYSSLWPLIMLMFIE